MSRAGRRARAGDRLALWLAPLLTVPRRGQYRDTPPAVRALPPALLLVLLFATGGARAAAPARFSLDYSAPHGCPPTAELVARIHARMPDAERVASGSPHASVRVARTGAGFDAALVWDGASGGVRHFQADRCGEVIDALALAIVVAMSGERASAAPAAPAPPSPHAASTPPRSTPAPRAAALPRPALLPRRRAARPVPPVHRERRWHGAVVASAGVTGDIAPDVAPMGSAAFELRLGGTQLLSPGLRASLGYARGTASDATFSSFHRVAAGLELCPLRVATRHPALSIEPCLGALSGSHGGELSSGGSASTFWFSLDALARVRWALSPRWFLELSGGVELPTTLNRFWVEQPARGTRRRAYLVPQIAGIAGIGAGATIF